MTAFALNHMTVARLNYVQLLDLAAALGCIGVEVRNDLRQPLFDGMGPAEAGALARAKGLRLLAVAEVKRFNDWSDDKAAEALALMQIAKAAGAEAVSLIPRNDNLGMGNGERQAALRVALKALKPMLEDHGLVGMVEPLGFEICALRYKSEAVEAIEAIGGKGRFKLVHDTFHHTLAHGGAFFPEHTGIIHISGVVDKAVTIGQMTDAHRVLVDGADRLGNIDQIAALQALGYGGPVSFEAFAPQVHASTHPQADLAASIQFIREAMQKRAA
ncbi:MAG: putative sugar isomerase [Rhodobacteraceae bacterium]|uniref:TIM barrel protein n=1 Tax=Cypionkella sp. TaxID=2811411 RepID=UPI00132C998D|nr:TIM barrel protein [Cypionkella sp.]KAF0175033.1 MAG: putative sugar isomerase [Paracoccaceae bacterium]MDO8325475.1 TIM barrel protein [Cypionkella sp.]